MQRAAARRRQARVDLRLAVCVADLDLAEADRRLVEAEIGRLRVEQKLRRRERAVDGEVGVQVTLELARRLAIAERRQAEPLNQIGSEDRAQVDGRRREAPRVKQSADR